MAACTALGRRALAARRLGIVAAVEAVQLVVGEAGLELGRRVVAGDEAHGQLLAPILGGGRGEVLPPFSVRATGEEQMRANALDAQVAVADVFRVDRDARLVRSRQARLPGHVICWLVA